MAIGIAKIENSQFRITGWNQHPRIGQVTTNQWSDKKVLGSRWDKKNGYGRENPLFGVKKIRIVQKERSGMIWNGDDQYYAPEHSHYLIVEAV